MVELNNKYSLRTWELAFECPSVILCAVLSNVLGVGLDDIFDIVLVFVLGKMSVVELDVDSSESKTERHQFPYTELYRPNRISV